MTTKELNMASLWERCADLEEKLYYKTAEVRDLQAEVEAANKRAKDYERIALDLGATMRQIAKYAQLEQGGTI